MNPLRHYCTRVFQETRNSVCIKQVLPIKLSNSSSLQTKARMLRRLSNAVKRGPFFVHTLQETIGHSRWTPKLLQSYSVSAATKVSDTKNDESSTSRASNQGYHKLPFMSKPCSLALPPDSKIRFQEPDYKGFRRLVLRMLLYYSKESIFIRHANVLHRRIVDQVDSPEIYDTFRLEKCFRTTFGLLVLHMWLFLSRLRLEGKEGVDLGQYLYEMYNNDLELRVAAAGVNLLLSRWMRDLEKIFYGNITAYDKAMKPEAGKKELCSTLWRNIFADGDVPMPEGPLAAPVQALERYTRHQYACLALTDREALLSGNLMFTSVKSAVQS